MQYVIDYDNESDGVEVELEAGDVPLLGIEPHKIENGNIAYYEFPEGTDEADIEDALENSNWCYKGMTWCYKGTTPAP